jgi:hypothetical protein
MKVEAHAPSQIALVVSLALAALALIAWFIGATSIAFWTAIAAYVAAALPTLVKTD